MTIQEKAELILKDIKKEKGYKERKRKQPYTDI